MVHATLLAPPNVSVPGPSAGARRAGPEREPQLQICFCLTAGASLSYSASATHRQHQVHASLNRRRRGAAMASAFLLPSCFLPTLIEVVQSRSCTTNKRPYPRQLRCSLIMTNVDYHRHRVSPREYCLVLYSLTILQFLSSQPSSSSFSAGSAIMARPAAARPTATRPH